jgi:hypothetical protein
VPQIVAVPDSSDNVSGTGKQAVDPAQEDVKDRWFEGVRPQGKETPVPSVIQSPRQENSSRCGHKRRLGFGMGQPAAGWPTTVI